MATTPNKAAPPKPPETPPAGPGSDQDTKPGTSGPEKLEGTWTWWEPAHQEDARPGKWQYNGPNAAQLCPTCGQHTLNEGVVTFSCEHGSQTVEVVRPAMPTQTPYERDSQAR